MTHKQSFFFKLIKSFRLKIKTIIRYAKIGDTKVKKEL